MARIGTTAVNATKALRRGVEVPASVVRRLTDEGYEQMACADCGKPSWVDIATIWHAGGLCPPCEREARFFGDDF